MRLFLIKDVAFISLCVQYATLTITTLLFKHKRCHIRVCEHHTHTNSRGQLARNQQRPRRLPLLQSGWRRLFQQQQQQHKW